MTDKQRRFCDEYLIDLNATQAAIRAGYSERTAYSIGEENLRKPEVKSYIDERLEEIRSEKTADAREVLEYLTAVMRGEQTEAVLKLVGGGEQAVANIEVSAKDRMKAAELLGKYYSLWTDKVNVQADAQITFVEDLTPDGES